MIEKVIKSNLCISCGLCSFNKQATMTMKKGIYIPEFKYNLEKNEDEFLYQVCPGKGYSIKELGEKYSEDAGIYDFRIGYYRSLGATYTLDNDFLIKSSSGGMMTYFAYYLLKEKIVDGILTVKFSYTDQGPVPHPFIAKNKQELLSAQGSKYMPIPLLQNIDDILSYHGSLAVIGTPCQIAGIRLFQKTNSQLNEKIKFCIANFCGGYRDFRETERIFKIFKINKKNISYFSYRGNGQPGTMSISQVTGTKTHISYPEYSRLTGYTKYYRCRLCVDATGELADISFGDAWLPRFINSGKKWSFYICRSKKAEKILEDIKAKNEATFKDISKDDLLLSQKGNIYTKKIRQFSRLSLHKLLRMNIPKFDGGYLIETTPNIKQELKVLLSHYFRYFLELIGIYLVIAKYFKLVNKNNYEVKDSNFMS